MLVLLPVAVALPTEQVPTVRLVDSDPGEDGVLASGEPLHRHVRYRSAVPIHVLLTGYDRGEVIHEVRRVAAASNEAGESGGFDPLDLIFLCVPGYLLLQVVLAYRTSGGWRKAALAPAVIMVPILAYTVLAFAAQSNLWPLLLLLTAPLAFLYLVLLSAILLLRRLAKPHDRRRSATGRRK
jgi:hypothetical protein